MSSLSEVLSEIRRRRVLCRENNVAPGTAQEDAIYRICEEIVSRALLSERELRTSPGWPDPLQSPQAEAIRSGKIDDVEIRNLFDQMEREIQVHRKTFCERRTAQGVTWQPIETAPKDGNDVLLSSPNWHGDVVVGCWSFEGWRDRENSDKLEPTHWMPLPAAPSLSTRAGGGE